MNTLDLAVIHDAKNSLNTLIYRLEQHGNLEKEIEIVLGASSRLTNLLLWHKQQEGEMRINLDSASPLDIVNDLTAEFSHTFPHIQIKLDVNNAPTFWFYDDFYIRLALGNALHNACSFAKSAVNISVSVLDNMLVFSLQDDGNGYSEQLLQAFADDSQIETSHRGTGLGLRIANIIAKMHENKGKIGQVTLKNIDGAWFEMKLP
jgi:K+-sensing histidine kinase KdpD